MSRFSGYDEEMNINLFDDDGVYASGDKIKSYISKMEEKDKENFVIVKSKLLYIGTDELELEAAKRLGLGSNGDSSDSEAAIQELQAIISGVVELNDKFEDTSITENKDTKIGFIGTKLVKRESKSLLDGTWNIVIEYDKENKETARYDEDYYWLKKGETYVIDNKELNFKNDYVIDYKNKEYQILSGRAVNWNEKATLGVTTNIALNLDPMSLANGEWVESRDVDEVNHKNFDDFIVKDTDGEDINTGIQKAGDVKYNNEIKALEFNRSEENETGEGGYLRLSEDELDFSNGFTFEIYCNLDRLLYDNIKNSDGLTVVCSGLFCRIPSLLHGIYSNAMRFGFGSDGTICKFYSSSSWTGDGNNLKTTSHRKRTEQ